MISSMLVSKRSEKMAFITYDMASPYCNDDAAKYYSCYSTPSQNATTTSD